MLCVRVLYSVHVCAVPVQSICTCVSCARALSLCGHVLCVLSNIRVYVCAPPMCVQLRALALSFLSQLNSEEACLFLSRKFTFKQRFIEILLLCLPMLSLFHYNEKVGNTMAFPSSFF